uniref:C2H2-type domain-containing protein n=1 Tax=Lutzomyia longipalpis TaxID=7200 RepID=A0A1B0GKX8_LUTLO
MKSPKRLFLSPIAKEAQVVVKSKRYNCTACPYVTDSKSQFVYHKSFHKPRGEQFKCTYCTYNVTKKHLLNQHIKLHRNEEISADNANDVRAPVQYDNPQTFENVEAKAKITLPTGNVEIMDDRRFLHFCDKCPMRFLCDKELRNHVKMHAAGMAIRCAFCSFSARQEALLQVHVLAHNDQYQVETKDLEEKYRISSENGKPILTSKTLNSNTVWVVESAQVAKSNQNSTEEDHEAQKEQKITRNCPNCPFVVILTAGNEGNGEKQLEDHIQHHLGTSSSGKYRVFCNFCDFATNTEKALKEHTKWHFAGSKKKTHNVEFFTKFDNVHIYGETSEKEGSKAEDDKSGTISIDNSKVIFAEAKNSLENSRIPLAEENKIFINLKTGEIVKKHASRF